MVGEIALMTEGAYRQREAAKSAYAAAHPRTVEASGNQILIDGKPFYFRATHFGGDYPLTGHPEKLFSRAQLIYLLTLVDYSPCLLDTMPHQLFHIPFLRFPGVSCSRSHPELVLPKWTHMELAFEECLFRIWFVNSLCF